MSWPQARSNLDRTFYPRLQPGTALGQCMPMGHRANQNMYNGTIDTETSTLTWVPQLIGFLVYVPG